MKLKCIKQRGICAYFTDGRVYPAYQLDSEVGTEYWTVRDDYGRERVVIPGARCRHITLPSSLEPLYKPRFEVVE